MARYKSRAKRLDEAMGVFDEAKSDLENVKSELEDYMEKLQQNEDEETKLEPEELAEIRTKVRALYEKASNVGTPDSSDVEGLRDEIQQWKENIEEKFSATQKYSDLEECEQNLEEVISSAENVSGVDTPQPKDDFSDVSADEIESVINSIEDNINYLEEVTDNASNVSFPGMY